MSQKQTKQSHIRIDASLRLNALSLTLSRVRINWFICALCLFVPSIWRWAEWNEYVSADFWLHISFFSYIFIKLFRHCFTSQCAHTVKQPPPSKRWIGQCAACVCSIGFKIGTLIYKYYEHHWTHIFVINWHWAQ